MALAGCLYGESTDFLEALEELHLKLDHPDEIICKKRIPKEGLKYVVYVMPFEITARSH